MEWEGLKIDRLRQDTAVEQQWMACFASLDLTLPISCPKDSGFP